MKIFHPSEIKSVRSKFGLTQADLAEEAGVTQAYIAKIEAGNADPKISTLEKISNALQKTAGKQKTSAEQVMEKPIISAHPDDKIKEAIKKMETNDISQIPIIQNKKQVGSISEQTILHKISAGKNMFELTEEKLREVMEEPFPTVGTDADLDTIFHLLEHNPAVLVLENGNPEGIVTKADILQLSMR